MMNFQKIKKLITNPYFSMGFLILLSLIASLQAYYVDDTNIIFTPYNNFVIFSQSFHHLLEGKDLYVAYPHEYWDLYKYSPAFSLFFGVFAFFPTVIGLSFWNIFNASILSLAIISLPNLTKKKLSILLLIIAIEALTSFQNEQSNALMAGLIVFAFSLLEKKKLFWAAGLIMASVFIKLFGLVAFILFLFYPHKIRNALYSLVWLLFFLFIPLISTDFQTLIMQYKSWGTMLSTDHAISYGYSVMGFLHSWFGLNSGKNILLLFGVIALVVPLVKWKFWKDAMYKLLFLSSILIWVVIFNHKAESPTFIIAMTGAAIWFVASTHNITNVALIILALIFTTFSPSDFFPEYCRKQFFEPYVIKVIPMILVWVKINIDIFMIRNPSLNEHKTI
jgi:hypothetical protein